MGHHKSKRKKNEMERENNTLNINDLSRMDLTTLIETLKTLNSNDITNLFSQLNLPSNIDKNQLEELINNPDPQKISSILSEVNINNNKDSTPMDTIVKSNEFKNVMTKAKQENVSAEDILGSLKPLLPIDKRNIIDQIMKIYNTKK